VSADLIGQQARPLDVLVLSDATGATADAMVTSALALFEKAKWLIRRYPLIRSVEQIEEILDVAAGRDCVVAFTFVSRGLGDELAEMCRQRQIPCFDILEPLMAELEKALGRPPEEAPGAYHQPTEDMFRLATAIDFALKHDDGQGMDTLDQADVVILGLSRSGKTPMSVYLSCRAVKAANIPIIQDVPLPEQVVRTAAPKVGLRMSMDRLLQIRSRRAERMGTDLPWYANRAEVYAELEYCERVFRSIPGLYTINVTNRSVEESSDLVVREVL